MRVLVTGGAGFIGSHVVQRFLELGDEVSIIDDLNDFYAPALEAGGEPSQGSGDGRRARR